MTLHITNFDEYTSGVQPTGWTKRYTTTNFACTVEDSDWSPAPGKRLHIVNSSGTNRKLFSWDVLDSVQNFNALMLVKVNNFTTNYLAGINFRASGGAGSETHYYLNNVAGSATMNDFRFTRITGGGGITGPGALITGPGTINGVYLWIRVQAVGSALKFKFWRFDHVEPNDWIAEVTNSDISAAGWWGFGSRAGAVTIDCYWLGVDDTATSVPFPYDEIAEDIYWGVPQIDGTGFSTNSNTNVVRALGGIFNEVDRELAAVSLRVQTHTAGKDVRIGVYRGGTATNPNGATLIADLGKTSGSDTGWITVTLPTPVAMGTSPGDFIWIVIKNNESSGFNVYYAATASMKNPQSARGTGRVTAGMSLDEDVAWPATFAVTTIIWDTVYALQLTLVQRSLFPEPPEEVRQTRMDISGNARDLSDIGTVPTGDVQGKIGNCAYYSGSGVGLLKVTQGPDLTGDAEFTIGVRAKLHASAAVAVDTTWRLTIGTLEVLIGIKAGETAGFVSAETPSLACATGNILTQDRWWSIAVYFDTSGLYIEIDDDEQASDAGASTGIASAATEVEAGVDAAGVVSFSIDELGIWVGANALSAAQRTVLYSGNYGQRPTFEA